MSLVEQALARMRNQAAAAKGNQAQPAAVKANQAAVVKADVQRKKADSKPRPAPAPRPLAAPFPEPPEAAKHMTLDIAKMRANGYLPEESRDRQFADHYRRIKRPLIDRVYEETDGTDMRVIMVTSALPGDGKTFTSINLAMSMALERDVSVLLIDCDVAKRHVSDIVGMRREVGLLDALVDESVDVESLVVQTNLRGLSILPAGKPVEATTELLSSNRMRQIIANLFVRNPRRILLLDSPPLLITNEGRALLKIAGQLALVVRAGHTPRHAVQEALALFDPEKPGGMILNHVTKSGGEGLYGYDSYGLYGEMGADAKES
jgi:exopolysaccharide/PEP-CTERM locus tyrosine autokinase